MPSLAQHTGENHFRHKEINQMCINLNYHSTSYNTSYRLSEGLSAMQAIFVMITLPMLLTGNIYFKIKK